MASAFKCDRCKKLKEGNSTGRFTLNGPDNSHTSYEREKILEVCEPCWWSCKDYIETAPPDPKKENFMEGFGT